MKIAGWLAVGLFASVVCAHAANAQGNLKASMEKLDAASKRFQSVQAEFQKELYDSIVKETTEQNGKLYFERPGGGVRLGIVTTGAEARTVEYKGGNLRVYNPGIKCFDPVSAGSQSRVETFLALGFGGSGADLEKSWTVTDLGPGEPVDGVKVEKLNLVPRDQSVKANVDHIVLWMDLERAIALKQILYAPNRDTQTAVYSHIRYNQKVDAGGFQIPSGAKACGK
jgi:outer membrane lipoprotein-sorting protein